MGYKHSKDESLTHGKSPGNGTTPMNLSKAPLATEGEATPGPDDYNPYEERDAERARVAQTQPPQPTKGEDPFTFDDIGGIVDEIGLPAPGDGPLF